jgi:hydroxyacylglutathione hydrolase
LKNNLLQFKQIPAFTDNYLWVVIQDQQAWVVDPGDAKPIITYFEQENISLRGILITHHHNDHIGGVGHLLEWAQAQGNQAVICCGPQHPNISHLTQVLQDGDVVNLFADVTLEVMSVPGHTLSHIAYFLPVGSHNLVPRLYCGDTLFAGGCGRLFEGSAEQMYGSLSKFAKLPENTLVCCAHEYTLSNLRFAEYLEPENQDLVKWHKQAQDLRHLNQSTVPTTIGLEKKVNPFMRCDQASIIQAAQREALQQLRSPAEVLAVIRKMKDSF